MSNTFTSLAGAFYGLTGAVRGAEDEAACAAVASAAIAAAALRIVTLNDEAADKRAAATRAAEAYEAARRNANRVWAERGGPCNEHFSARKAEVEAGEAARAADRAAGETEALLWLAQRDLPKQADEASRSAAWATWEAARARRCLENVRETLRTERALALV